MIHKNISIGLAGQLEAKVNIDYALMIIVGLSRDYPEIIQGLSGDYLGINKGFSRYYPRVSTLDIQLFLKN